MKPIVKELPELYSAFLPNFFKNKIPAEELATCSDCAMCNKNNASEFPETSYFKPDAKCCTFYPTLPNYLVGAILMEKDKAMAEGKKRIKNLIKSKKGVSPLGVLTPKKYEFLYKISNMNSFGKSYSLLCPYFEKRGGLCTIWKYRNSVCSTWFCKTVAGEDGKAFWSNLNNYLGDAETSLSKYVAFQFGIDPDNIINSHTPGHKSEHVELFPEDLDDTSNAEKHRKLWGKWDGQEESFYLEAFRLIAKLDKKNFEHITGMHQNILLKKVENSYNKMMKPILPKKMKRNSGVEIVKIKDGSYTFSLGLNSFNIPPEGFEVFNLFDGVRKCDEIIKVASKEKKIDVDEDFLIMFHQNRFLIEAK